mmetsp:Transcript_13101/g.15004  ORF Transcript_13101/g.15004 Transcript_13101/m.15004 type:complete len:316 (-) Transcript_13101:48-995(-)|eukprot:CAMPEP_0184037976 /NCGR_PEP_ID=MMETSP0955-20130417/43488_1 /TAXON_ID=627963 /ORGANISM="Aplanochytrium sp, Strain PBS07" /LENGTH=315 /DNA_ID=CAMNT_0026326349 /DNA_START=226 /DNA_END=1173 /DNA_ORIENTATION=+
MAKEEGDGNLAAGFPSEPELRTAMEEILEGANLDELTTKKVRKALELKFGVELRSKKQFIKTTLTDLVMKREEEASAGEVEMEDTSVVKKEGSSGKKGGFSHKKLILSDTLSSVLGVTHETRPQVVKRMWAYIKENNLQDPSDGRKILLDSSLKKVFNRDTFTAFNMNRYLKGHLKSEETDEFPTVLASDDEEYIKQKEERKRKREKENKKKKARLKKLKKNKPKVVDPNKPKVLNAFTRPIQISEELSSFLGQEKASRSEVVKKLWQYIKENELQNPEDKREINCDQKLKSLLGEDKVTAFSINKLIQKHYIKT